MTANRTPAWWRVIDWRMVLAAGVPAWLLVCGLVVWVKLSPPRPTLVITAPPVATGVAETAPMARLVAEVSPMPRAVREVAGMPHAPAPLAPTPRAASERPVGDPAPVLDLLASVFRRFARPNPAAVAEKPVPAGCKTHGTAVHFAKSTLDAMKQAKAKGKLVFVLHLSGNIEDPGFT